MMNFRCLSRHCITRASLLVLLSLPILVPACAGTDELSSNTSSTSLTTSSSASSGSTSSSGSGGEGGAGQGGAGQGGGGQGGTGQGGSSATTIADIVAELSANLEGTLDKYAGLDGWPVFVEDGFLFVSTDPNLNLVAGDHDNWAGTQMTQQGDFHWIHLKVAYGTRYKFTNKTVWKADPWARSYTYDPNGEMSLVRPIAAHLDRFLRIGNAEMPERRVNVWVPLEKPTHVLYVHDGQNLFDPKAAWGGWALQDSVPPAVMLVGIDNTGEGRMFEYTHVEDMIDLNDDGVDELWGGKGDAYADFVNTTVRKLVADSYGEPSKVGTMGSSLGGLISLHIADRFPGQYTFAASLSGTLGWGKIGGTSKNQTMIERYVSHGHRSTFLYIDAGGGDPGLSQQQNEAKCVDTDGDGIKDDVGIGDNACENAQMRDALIGVGYKLGVDAVHWWEPGAAHNEAEWRTRVFRPLDLFVGL
jgi:predicted alpha/beta superfamily hydrolase